MQRIATSRHYAATPPDIRYRWPYRDQLEAHKTLDALDRVDLINRPDLPKKRGKHG